MQRAWLFIVLCISSLSSAQTPPEPPTSYSSTDPPVLRNDAPRSPPPIVDRGRFRFGVSALGEFTSDTRRVSSAYGGGVGAELRFGAQLSDRFAVYGTPGFGLFLFGYVLRLGAMAEFTPVQWLSLAAGLQAKAYGVVLSLAPRNRLAFGLPVRVTFNLPANAERRSVARNRFTIAIEGWLGVSTVPTVTGPGVPPPVGAAAGATLALGYDRM